MISLEPSHFRSPLIDELPPESPGRSARSVRRRRLAVVLALAAAVLPAAAVGRRWLSPEGPGRPLFWLHDAVYLPLKGYLFTWLFPLSPIYLLAGLTLLAFAAAAVAWKRPLTPAWQTVVGRRVLSWPWMRPVLRVWKRSFRGLRRLVRAAAAATGRWPAVGRRLSGWAGVLDGPTLLEELVEHEREAALERLDGLVPTDPESVRALTPAVDATFLSMALASPTGLRSDRRIVESVERLDDVLLRLDLVRVAGGDPEPSIEALRSRLEAEISALLRPVLPVRPRDPDPKADFSLSSLAVELALVLGLETPAGWPPELLERGPQRVLEGVEARRRSLDRSRRRLERSAAYSLRRPGRRIAAELPDSGRRIEARLALDVALFAALRHGALRGALAFLESLEGLRFAVLAAGAAGEPEAAGSPAAGSFLSAVAGLPRPLDYRVCAHLLERETAAAGDLAAALARRSEVISEADLRLASARRADLSTAAADPPPSGSRRSRPTRSGSVP